MRICSPCTFVHVSRPPGFVVAVAGLAACLIFVDARAGLLGILTPGQISPKFRDQSLEVVWLRGRRRCCHWIPERPIMAWNGVEGKQFHPRRGPGKATRPATIVRAILATRGQYMGTKECIRRTRRGRARSLCVPCLKNDGMHCPAHLLLLLAPQPDRPPLWTAT